MVQLVRLSDCSKGSQVRSSQGQCKNHFFLPYFGVVIVRVLGSTFLELKELCRKDIGLGCLLGSSEKPTPQALAGCNEEQKRRKYFLGHM